MQLPNVLTEIKDSALNFTFAVRAYRRLTQEEMQYSYTHWRSQKKSNKPKKNIRIEIISLIGHNE